MITSNPVNFTPPMQAGLFYAKRCKVGWQLLTSSKLPNYGRSAVARNAFSLRVLSQMS